jgi:ribosomal protein S8
MSISKIINNIQQAKNNKKVSIFTVDSKSNLKILRFLVSEGFLTKILKKPTGLELYIRYSKNTVKSSITGYNKHSGESLLKSKVKSSRNFNIIISSTSKGYALSNGKLNLKIR